MNGLGLPRTENLSQKKPGIQVTQLGFGLPARWSTYSVISGSWAYKARGLMGLFLATNSIRISAMPFRLECSTGSEFVHSAKSFSLRKMIASSSVATNIETILTTSSDWSRDISRNGEAGRGNVTLLAPVNCEKTGNHQH